MFIWAPCILGQWLQLIGFGLQSPPLGSKGLSPGLVVESVQGTSTLHRVPCGLRWIRTLVAQYRAIMKTYKLKSISFPCLDVSRKFIIHFWDYFQFGLTILIYRENSNMRDVRFQRWPPWIQEVAPPTDTHDVALCFTCHLVLYIICISNSIINIFFVQDSVFRSSVISP